jgi:hypothetical protein
MSVEKVLTIQGTSGDATGVTVSPVYQYFDDANQYTWAVDIDLLDGSEVLRCVPIATNNREIFYADQGKPVALRKENNKWVVIGLSKTVKDFEHRMHVCFEDDIAQVVSDEMVGYKARMLTYGELGDLVPGSGYGFFPYGVMGRFDYEGNLIEIIETRPI